MTTSRWVAIAAGTLLALSGVFANAATAFYFTSSPSAWVGGGETVTVDDSNFDFFVSRNFDNGVGFDINDFNINPDFQTQRWWSLNFAAPNDAELQSGSYAGATRFPFQDPSSPGLDFSGNGRGNNMLSGFFTIHEVSYATDGSVLTFAADFMQFDEMIAEWWNWGSIRYNSDVPLTLQPVPLPAGLWLFVSAGSLLAALRRRL